MSNEIWKDIIGYKGYYQISSYGRVKSLERIVEMCNYSKKTKSIFIKLWFNNNNGYLYLGLHKNGIKKTMPIHRLVATHFISNPENKKTVNHINGIKTDNKVENIEWATQSENNKHAHRIGLMTKDYCSKKVLQIKDNFVMNEFESIREANRKTNTNRKHIKDCCEGNRDSANGYEWKYAQKEKAQI